MDTDFYYFKWVHEERFIANEPWYKALQQRRKDRHKDHNTNNNDSGDTFTDDVTVEGPQCNNRFSYKLQSISRDGRSAMENESWNNILLHSEKQARLRAVQLHLSCVATLAALPYALSCCGCKPLPAAPAAIDGLTTDEMERE